MSHALDEPLFQELPKKGEGGFTLRPLAEKMRPRSLKEVFGQEHLLGNQCLLPKLVRKNSVGNLIFAGPPGSGKTTLAHVIAKESGCRLLKINAVTSNVKELREALNRLALNDPSFEFEPETSDALGFGFRCGFLGLLHMEIVQQRLEQESDIDLVQTAPNVTYEITTTHGEVLEIHRPQEVPDAGDIAEFRQPVVRVSLVIPAEYIGPVMTLCQDRRGVQRSTEYLSPTRAMLIYDMALAEVVYDLHDKLKSVTRGYGTMDYELIGYQAANLVRLDILVNGDPVDALSVICEKEDSDQRGRAVVKKLKQEIDRHMFEIAVQAAIGARVIARETVPAFRKNVTAKCYGGDVSRKKKLLEKQKAGKKRMKQVGRVEIPQDAFLAVLKVND